MRYSACVAWSEGFTSGNYHADRGEHLYLATMMGWQFAAVELGGTRLPGAELDAAANRLAHLLMEEGVGPEALVALTLQASPDWVTALLAVWKAGGAVVTIDPGLPAPRRERMAAGAALRVGGDWLAARAERLAARPATPPGRGPAPDQLA